VKVVETIGMNGQVNYTEGLIRAKGIGAAPAKVENIAQARALALRSAKADAFRQLLETVKGVRVSSDTLVENFITTKNEINLKVSGMIHSAGVVDEKYLSDGSVEVTVQMDLTGDLSHLLIPHGEPGTSGMQGNPNVSPRIDGSGTATGIIIDASGLNVRPCMCPQIQTTDGKEVYGSAFVDRNFAVTQGMVGYVKTIDQAMGNTRVTEPPPPNPIVFKAEATVGSLKSDLQISASDASKIQSIKDHLNILQNCRVIIVVGE